jgi:hypothetical protein
MFFDIQFPNFDKGDSLKYAMQASIVALHDTHVPTAQTIWIAST